MLTLSAIYTKAWFPYDRYHRWEKKSSAIAAIIAGIWKPLCSDRWDRTFAICSNVVSICFAELFPLSDRSDHMETRLKWTTFYHVFRLQKFASIDISVKLIGILMSLRPTFFAMKPNQETPKRLRNKKTTTTTKTTLFIHGVLSTKQCSPRKPCATIVNYWRTKYINSKRSKLSTLRIA